MKILTIDKAIARLQELRQDSPLKGETCLVLSLIDSELEDVNIQEDGINLEVNQDAAYVEVGVAHHALWCPRPNPGG